MIARSVSRRPGEDGQAAVELVLVLPVVLLALLMVVQLGVLVRSQVLVVHAAREGARAAAIGMKAMRGLTPYSIQALHRRLG